MTIKDSAIEEASGPQRLRTEVMMKIECHCPAGKRPHHRYVLAPAHIDNARTRSS